MKIVLFCHPTFMKSESMHRFAKMLKSSYEARGFKVDSWSPRNTFHRSIRISWLSKWAGYIDQYVMFPIWVRHALRKTSSDTLFVFCDQALGPWVPLVKNRPHVVHVHDLLALRSALGDIPEHKTSLTGRLYQAYIRRGFQAAQNFISISAKTRDDLHRFGGVTPLISEVVYNGLNFPYKRLEPQAARRLIANAELPAIRRGLLLHVGGGQWYKNLPGVISIYSHYAASEDNPLPLWCISPEPGPDVAGLLAKMPKGGSVKFLQNVDDTMLQAVYSLSHALLFPSLAEGFGWPLIEAQACGCPVITTDEAPMNEVGGPAARYLPKLQNTKDMDKWASHGAAMLRQVLSTGDLEAAQTAQIGIRWTRQFTSEKAISAYLRIYDRAVANYGDRLPLH